MPPFELSQIYKEETLEERIKVYYLCEGANTEPGFFDSLNSKCNPFLINEHIRMYPFLKTEKDSGVTQAKIMVEKAIKAVENNSSFDKNIDKVIVAFDLDVLNDNDIKELLENKPNYMIYMFSNPKIELILLMSILNDLDGIEKQYYTKGFPNTILEKQFSISTGLNSKTKNAGHYAAMRYQKIMNNNKYDCIELKKETKFGTNVNFVLEALQTGDFSKL